MLADNKLTEHNKADKANKLVTYAKAWHEAYGKKGHVLIPFGDDFKYKNAANWFDNLDKLIEVVNKEHKDVHIFYSSPQCYIKAVKDHKVEVKSNDYFPTINGYYSSRPVIKSMERYADGLLQAAKQLDVLAHLSNASALLFEAKNEMGILQVSEQDANF